MKRPALVPGFRASGVHSGVKQGGLDLAVIASDEPATVAGVFTRSTIVGAPVELCRRRIRRGRGRAVVVNSGIANVAMGREGRQGAERMAAWTAEALGCRASEVYVASTGVIGEPLPLERLRRAIPEAVRRLTPKGLSRAARAILTTDTVPKIARRRLRLGGTPVTVAGIAKGSGMIQPDMATMLSFLMTDAAVDPMVLRGCLRDASDHSFNRLSIDGETSTSDMVLLFANGVAGNTPLRTPRSPGVRAFGEALGELCEELARALARDGEGATKLLTARVRGAHSAAEAERAARRIANSPLVKTAIFGRDPNWGRILQTVGAARVRVDLERAEVRLCGVPVFRHGAGLGAAARRRAGARMRRPEILVEFDLGVGRAEATLWTCDLTYDYVRINAEYTT
ncbi:MAG: bifunctional glutamate N-acetyltransferase/amino-acid acetyltransferase ArgJ [Myxococcota bacterium]